MRMRRLPALPMVLSAFVLGMGTNVRGQHATTPDTPATQTEASKSVEPGQAPKPAVRPVVPPARPRTPDVKTVVDRIQKRIDQELGPAAAPRTPPKPLLSRTTAAPVAASPTPRRIHLTWRASLVWPDELTEPQAEPKAPATVVWP
jgi:hypothetical protein